MIHLGHNRSVGDIIAAALQEDADGIAISSYQGGHNEYFKYMIDLLKEKKLEHIKVFGGGGGVITPEEIVNLQNYGVSRIYSPHDGQSLGLEGIAQHMIEQTASTVKNGLKLRPDELSLQLQVKDEKAFSILSRLITLVEESKEEENAYLQKNSSIKGKQKRNCCRLYRDRRSR